MEICKLQKRAQRETSNEGGHVQCPENVRMLFLEGDVV